MAMSMAGLMATGCKQGGTLEVCNGPCEIHESSEATQLNVPETHEYMKLLPGAKGPGTHIDVNAEGKNLHFTLDHDASHVTGPGTTTVLKDKGLNPNEVPVRTVLSPAAKAILQERALNGVNR